MGLSIHYRGTLTDKRQSAALLSELEDIVARIDLLLRKMRDWEAD